MPVPKEQQKLIVFRDEDTKSLIDCFVKAEAMVSHLPLSSSSSLLIEKHILNDILPLNPIGREMVIDLFIRSSVKDILVRIFSLKTHKCKNHKTSWSSDLLPFVEFCSKQKRLNKAFSHSKYNNREYSKLIFSLKNVSIILTTRNNENNDLLLANTIQYLNDSIRLTEENIDAVAMYTYMEILIQNWSVLQDDIDTYNALCAILETDSDWLDSPEEKYDLSNLIKMYSKEW